MVRGLAGLSMGLLLLGCAVRGGPDAATSPDAALARLAEVDGKLQSESHAFEEVAPGVYFATPTGAVNLVSNAMVVVNEDDVLIVDSHVTPDAARALLESVRLLTEKPVRYLVNTHFHFDHAHGNQVFPGGVEIIGHEYTRERLLRDALAEPIYQLVGSPEAERNALADLEEQLKAAASEEARSDIEARIAMLRRHIAALGEVEPTPPNLTLIRKLTLFRGAREIQLHHLGRGHTGGDVVVFLPAEKVVFTGDLLFDGAPYLGDAYPEEFVETLERLKELEFDVIVPGHGRLVRNRALIDFTQEYLRTYWGRVARLHARGLSVEEAVAELDLSEYEEWAVFQLSRPEVLDLEVRRMYRLLDGGH